MKKVIIAMVLVLAVAFVTAACESAPTKNDGTTRKNEVDAPDWVIHQGLEGRICGIGITLDNDPKLAEDRGRLDLARKVVSLGTILHDSEQQANLTVEDKMIAVFEVMSNKNKEKTKSDYEQEAKIGQFITKNFNKIEVFGEWKSAGQLYKLMCLLTEEEIRDRIDKLFEVDEAPKEMLKFDRSKYLKFYKNGEE